MMTEPSLELDDPRTYVIPITNLIGLRLNKIATLNLKLKINIDKLYLIPSNEDKNEICNEIRNYIIEIEKLVSKNIEDSQIIEYAIIEHTKPIDFTLPQMPISDESYTDSHMYIQ
jgi:hypothetical protein